MTPYLNAATDGEKKYNIVHKKTRHMVERCIGVLKSRFRCICRQRVLMYSPQVAGRIINSCTILHDIMLLEGHPLPSNEDIEEQLDLNEQDENTYELPENHIELNLQRAACTNRQTLTNILINTNVQ